MPIVQSLQSRRLADQVNHSHEQRRTYTCDPRGKPTFGLLTEQKTWQSSEGIHLSTSTSAEASLQHPAEASGISPIVEPTTSATSLKVLPTASEYIRRVRSSGTLSINGPKKLKPIRLRITRHFVRLIDLEGSSANDPCFVQRPFRRIVWRRVFAFRKQESKGSSEASELKGSKQLPLPDFQNLILNERPPDIAESNSAGLYGGMKTPSYKIPKVAGGTVRGVPSAETQALVDTQPGKRREIRKSSSEYSDYERNKQLTKAAEQSFSRLMREIRYLSKSIPKNTNRTNFILTGMEFEFKGLELWKLAHDTRWWCRHREERHALSEGRAVSGTPIPVLKADVRRRAHCEVGAKFVRSWGEMYSRYIVWESLRGLCALSSRKASSDLYESLIGPLNMTITKISMLLRCDNYTLTNDWYKRSNDYLDLLAKLASSWRALRRVWQILLRREAHLKLLQHHYNANESYRRLHRFLYLLGYETERSTRPSGSMISTSPLGEHLASKTLQELEGDKTRIHAAVGSVGGEGVRTQAQCTKSLLHSVPENKEKAVIFPHFSQYKYQRPQPAAPIFLPRQLCGGSSGNSVVATPSVAAFHTARQVSGPSSAENGTVTTLDRSREGKSDLDNDKSSMTNHQLSGPLGYHIPSDKMRESMLASRSSRSAYWQYTLYEGPKGQKVKVHYCKSLETTERISRLFVNEKVIGFDIEWKPSATFKDGIRKNVALIQLASEERIALFHVARFSKDDTIESLVAPTFKAIMETSSITKVGVSVKGDCTRLRNHMNIDSHGLFELSHLNKLVKFSLTDVKKINKVLVALAKQVEEHLMLPMYKDDSVRGSDWSEGLNYEQIY
ncbi:MAG: hypothetical protein Q9172_007137, partial [Xanthocarpia lactea]